MHEKDKPRQTDDQQSAEEARSKRADAGAAPEQSDEAPDPKPDPKPDEKPDEKDDLVDPREKRQDPPVPGEPKKIRVER